MRHRCKCGNRRTVFGFVNEKSVYLYCSSCRRRVQWIRTQAFRRRKALQLEAQMQRDYEAAIAETLRGFLKGGTKYIEYVMGLGKF